MYQAQAPCKARRPSDLTPDAGASAYIALTPKSAVLLAQLNGQPLDRLPEYYQQAMAWKQNEYRMYGKTVLSPRMVALMGDHEYRYSGQTQKPVPWDEHTKSLQSIAERALAELGHSQRLEYNGCLFNLYRTGQDSLGMHLDNEQGMDLSMPLMSVSLGAPRTFLMKTAEDSFSLKLHHGQVLLMLGDFHREVMHGVPKEQAVGPRVNLTFRKFVEK